MAKQMIDDFNENELFSATTVRREAMAQPISNPLARFFRMPGQHVRLPTGGAFLPPGALEHTMANDIPVLAMRGEDEILLKSPDALMSGYALEKLLQSCVPSLKTPRMVSIPDLDVLLLAIRAATYGENMSITANCPKCDTENSFDCHLPSLLGTMTTVDHENPIRLSDEIIAYVRPYNLYNVTKVALASYEEARKLQALELKDGERDSTKSFEVNRSLERLSRLNLEMLADCILRVVVPGSDVIDPAHIREFLLNVKKPWVDNIEKKVREINNRGIDKTVKAVCQNAECKHEWSTKVEFDPSTFFAAGSSV